MTQRTGGSSPRPDHKQELIDVFSRASKSKDLLDLFLQDLLTPAEYRELVNRWQIVKKLEKGSGQREIAGELKVGLGTVVRGARALLRSKGGFRRLLGK